VTEPTDPGPTPTSSFSSSTTQGTQRFSAKQAEHELSRDRQKHNLAEEAKDNDLRRQMLIVVGIVIFVVLAVSFIVAATSENDGTRAWAQGVVSTITGGIVGAVAGYFTGRSSK
jgi:uncharacterized membrane-anchored protein YjiN (DUF445 family)